MSALADGPMGSLFGSCALLASPHTLAHSGGVAPAVTPPPAPPTLLGGYPYPTHSNKDILETLQAGKRLDKPKNCTQDM